MLLVPDTVRNILIQFKTEEMTPKSIFPCQHCGENRYGEVIQQANTYGQSLVIVHKCATCDRTTIENLPTSYSVNKHNPPC